MKRAVEEVGRIFGDVGLGQFQLSLSSPVERGDYLTVIDELHGKRGTGRPTARIPHGFRQDDLAFR